MTIDREPLSSNPDGEKKPDSGKIGAANRGEAPKGAEANEKRTKVRAIKPGFDFTHRMIDEVFFAPKNAKGEEILDSSWYVQTTDDAVLGRPGGPNDKKPGFGLVPTKEETGFRKEGGQFVLPDDGISGGGAKLEEQRKADQQKQEVHKQADATRKAAEDKESKELDASAKRRADRQAEKDRLTAARAKEQADRDAAQRAEADAKANASRRDLHSREVRSAGGNPPVSQPPVIATQEDGSALVT